MKTSDKGRKFIEGFEGLILSAYDDATDQVVAVGSEPRGTLTIGYGHTNAAGPPEVHVGQTITAAQSDEILSNDLGKVEESVSKLVLVPLTQNQFDALVSFEFNTGALGRSTLLKELNAKNYTSAADDFLAWNHANGQVMRGLTRRREAERAMFLTPSTPVNVTAINHTSTAIIASTTAVVVSQNTSAQHSPLIFLGIILVAVVIGGLVHWYLNRKV